MSLEDVIAGAIEDAREGGLEGAQGGDDEGTLLESSDDTPADETPAGDETPASGDDATGDGVDGSADGEKTEEQKTAEAAAALEAADKAKDKPVDGAKPVEKKDEFDLKKELGLKDRTDGRVHRIPLPRVEKIIANAREKATTEIKAVVSTVGKALGLSEADIVTATPETLAPRLTEAFADVEALRAQAAVMDSLSPVMLGDGDRFVKMLAASNPAQYSKFLAVLEPDFKPPVAQELPAEANDPKPQADIIVTLQDGTKGKTYSPEGYQKLLDWQDRKSQRVYKAELDKRFKPLDDQQKAQQTLAERQQQTVDRMNEFMDEATQWREFEPNKDAILEATKKVDKKIPFRRAVRMAYEEVVLGKLHTDRTKMRAELLAEIKAATTTTTSAKKGTAPRKPADEAPVKGEGGEVVEGTEAAIRRSLAKARASGQIR